VKALVEARVTDGSELLAEPARSLRTQQRAWAASTVTSSVPAVLPKESLPKEQLY